MSLDATSTFSHALGVVGLGYVGLPLAVEAVEAGLSVVGVDTSVTTVNSIMAGRSHIGDVTSERLDAAVSSGRLTATVDAAALSDCEMISICVPTPLNKIKDPDLSYVVRATETIIEHLRPGQILVLESTTYPGTTNDVLRPLVEESGLVVGESVFLCYSPERVDPGNVEWHTKNTPKVIGGVTPACLAAGRAVYDKIFDELVPVSSAQAAELVKVYENTFRMINIALANELAQACDKLELDVWEVVEAAATKPFGFTKFTPGPGLGGHCIPLDPHYLSWKMRSLNYKTRMIELASEINSEMPAFVARKIADALNDDAKALRGSRVLVLGIAYKKDIDDLRESPALEVIQLLQDKGAEVVYHDPFCPVIADDGHTSLSNLPLQSVELTAVEIANADAVVVITDHSTVDYGMLREHAQTIIDTRGVLRGIEGRARVIGLSDARLMGDGAISESSVTLAPTVTST